MGEFPKLNFNQLTKIIERENIFRHSNQLPLVTQSKSQSLGLCQSYPSLIRLNRLVTTQITELYLRNSNRVTAYQIERGREIDRLITEKIFHLLEMLKVFEKETLKNISNILNAKTSCIVETLEFRTRTMTFYFLRKNP